MAKRKTKSAKKKTAVKRTLKKSTPRSKSKKTAKTTAKKTVKRKIKEIETKTTQNVIAAGSDSLIKNEQQNIKKTENQPGKTSYSKEELEYFKQILLKKREEILEMLEFHRQSLIESTTQNDKPVGTPYSIHMEYGTETEEREKTMFFIAREEKMLNYIDAALVRIERGTYGVCVSCGKLIDKRRLEAVPHTQLCIECKLAQKKRF
ncbi:transcriptional regulator, TraR/DksA family [Candidatus Kryptobacter tengchongensis]|uniref:Transcriptional regulator, TraR/DksA family n=1 Tax=Kryptobacter tengchongensis TaxID=1643429 RepID=A0A916PBR3_KRYT1|nr:TraR/DksA family transcriptional regulator [Candidatus Kryptobacter tengchongensis]CUT01440.1 transcriptional regulator, TraR/DksA family [Candidatus Kryptobacter tengchongensis]CUU06730.1 transcriptional regulator, TraR/DksA family [Candidatus Kryptobacter tengchongensis]CUU09556.1 transcriptional regulator, TraR/DksA family [Candidatus Kryptobacter tengchongensis]